MPKRVGYLYDKMVDREFIRAVILDASKGRRNRKDIARVMADLDGYVEKTYELVASESFVPSEPKIREIYDESSEKHRKIKMVPFWPDGVIQWMLVTAMKPVLMRGMHPWSCASIPGRGGKRIHKKIRGALRNDPKGTKYAAELDVAQYYPSISGKRLIWALARKIKDKRFLRTVYSHRILRRRAGHRVLHLPMAGKLLPGVSGPVRHDAAGREVYDPLHGQHHPARAEQETAA